MQINKCDTPEKLTALFAWLAHPATPWEKEGVSLSKLDQLIKNHMRLIVGQTENAKTAPKLQQSLFDLSKRMEKEHTFDSPEGHHLAFEVTTVAMGIFTKPEDPQKPEWTELPPEVLRIIFSKNPPKNSRRSELYDCSEVSKEWNKNTEIVKKLWIGQEIISLRDYGCRFSWEAVRCVFNKNLTKANLEGFDYITEFDLNFLTENCPRLRHLILPSAFRIEEFSLEKLTNLKTLNISKCDNLSKRVLSEGPTKLRQLTFLSLPRKFAEIESLMELTKLTHLSLSRCNKIPVDKLLETLKNLTELTSLDLGHCVQISADNLVELLKTLKKLNCLNLSENYQIPEDRLVEALKNLPKLTRLNLRGCSITDNEGAKALENLSQLTYLDLSYCAITVGRLDLLLKNLLQLRELNSMFVTEISKEDVKEWQKRYPNIKFTQCTHLDPFWDITEGELDQLLKNLPQLEEVNLMQCNRITKDIVGELRKQHTNIKFIHKYDV